MDKPKSTSVEINSEDASLISKRLYAIIEKAETPFATLRFQAEKEENAPGIYQAILNLLIISSKHIDIPYIGL